MNFLTFSPRLICPIRKKFAFLFWHARTSSSLSSTRMFRCAPSVAECFTHGTLCRARDGCIHTFRAEPEEAVTHSIDHREIWRATAWEWRRTDTGFVLPIALCRDFRRPNFPYLFGVCRHHWARVSWLSPSLTYSSPYQLCSFFLLAKGTAAADACTLEIVNRNILEKLDIFLSVTHSKVFASFLILNLIL